MAYDFGSTQLGIKNPFRPEGAIRALAGCAVVAMGVWQLLQVSADLEQDLVKAWMTAILGFTLLVAGLHRTGTGLFQLFRFYVGRSVPTSLSYNFDPIEQKNAVQEKRSLAYDAGELESMLMGRKNTTFREPEGWLARFIHSVLPKLIFMPHKIRNYAQELSAMLATTLSGLIGFAVAYFVSVSGLVGDAGEFITPVLSVLLLIYLVISWRRVAKALTEGRSNMLRQKGVKGLALMIGFAILVPVAIGYFYNQQQDTVIAVLEAWSALLGDFNAWTNLVLLAVVAIAVLLASWFLLIQRFRLANPITEVAEYRENLQESVHPNEIFINIENIVLANRRYKEIPNRVYRNFDPQLDEQSQGKGSFNGKLLMETQPEFQPMQYPPKFAVCRLVATLVGQSLLVAASAFLIVLEGQIYTLYSAVHDVAGGFWVWPDEVIREQWLQALSNTLPSLLTILFAWLTLVAGGKILANGAHLFWSEMHFSSLLMWMKTEGTFTESKLSTGMSIHDSTRSENVVVRSSITPWVLTSRVLTSTFALSGTQNLESPRYVLEMRKNTDELQDIIHDMTSFLRDREAIASITNERDLGNADTIYQVNQATRSQLSQDSEQRTRDEQAAGYLRQEAMDDESQQTEESQPTTDYDGAAGHDSDDNKAESER